jgi:hypothetical protein
LCPEYPLIQATNDVYQIDTHLPIVCGSILIGKGRKKREVRLGRTFRLRSSNK